ncbi:MAG: Rv1355c family protein, partial [Acidimicrobiales bacterium]
DIVDASQTSARGAASLAEVGRTLSTWPQLAGDVTLGGATVAAAVRRLGLGEPLPSGRVRVDLDVLVGTVAPPPAYREAWPDPPPEPCRPDTDDPLVVVAHAASLAPSGGNAQPWRFTAGGDRFSIELDRGRTSAMDVRSRGSLVAIGAALFNARAAAAAVGRLGPVALFPGGPHSDAVATMTLGRDGDPELAAMYPDVLRRAANRRRGTHEPLDPAVAGRLVAAAAAEGGGLRLITGEDQMAACAEILGASERVRFLTERLHREMIGELRWPGDDLSTGIDVRTLELGPSDEAALRVVRRGDVMELLEDWDAGSALGENARGAVRSSSALAVVTVPSASPLGYVHGGSAVERVWVTAQQAGLGVQPVSPVFVFAVQDADFATLGGDRWADELRALAGRFRAAVELAPADAVALVLRLSHVGPPSVRSQRLPLDQVLVVEEQPAGA